LVDNVLMPPLGKLIAGIDFSKLKVVLSPAVTEDGEVIKPEAAIAYGQFITDLIAFLLMAFAVFIVVKKVLVAMKKEEAAPPAKPPEPSGEEKLLAEIRDLLKQKA